MNQFNFHFITILHYLEFSEKPSQNQVHSS